MEHTNRIIPIETVSQAAFCEGNFCSAFVKLDNCMPDHGILIPVKKGSE